MTNSIPAIAFVFLMGVLSGQILFGGLAGYFKADCENELHTKILLYSCEFVKKIAGD